VLPELRIAATHQLTTGELLALRALLDDAFDGDLSDDDWNHCLGGRHILAVHDHAFISHAAIAERVLVAGERAFRTGYVEGVATSPGHRGKGHGSRVMEAIAEIVRRDFELGALATGRPSFYARLGWEPWRGPTKVATATGPERTPDEDDAIMVLRTGPSRSLDLTTDLVCDWRPGEVW
jgi:aminoglycoside 2'-N-acetyltransferase I